jgi:hypothetical protein
MSEEILHLKNTLRGGNELSSGGSAHSGFVDPYGISDLTHGHGLQVRRASIHKLTLTQSDLTADVQDCLLALLDAFNEKISAPYFIA